MVTVSHIVKKIVQEQPFVEEALSQNIINFANYAEKLQPRIEKELNRKIKPSAIVMSLRRFAEELSSNRKKISKFDYKGEIIIKSNICDFTFVKSLSLLASLSSIHKLVDFEKGDTLNVILGSNEVSILTNERHSEKLLKFLSGEKIVNKEKDLISLTVIFTEDDFTHTPGVIFNTVRKLAWENINIFEIISTMTELTFILSRKDSMKAYNVLQEIIG